jgi:hypothetical protein
MRVERRRGRGRVRREGGRERETVREREILSSFSPLSWRKK